MSIKLTPRAKHDLKEIKARYTASSPETAARIIRELDATFQLLHNFPLSGKERPELLEELRSFPKHPHIIFYKPTAHGIEITRVLDARRDMDHEDI
jgi:toxin ParE1/3/4